MATGLLSYGSLPEPHIDPPCMTSGEYDAMTDLQRQIEEVQDEVTKADDAFDSWAEFIGQFNALDYPEELRAQVDRLGDAFNLWLGSHLGALRASLVELHMEMEDRFEPWK